MIIFLRAGLLFLGHGKTKKHPVYWYDKQYDRLYHEWQGLYPLKKLTDR